MDWWLCPWGGPGTQALSFLLLLHRLGDGLCGPEWLIRCHISISTKGGEGERGICRRIHPESFCVVDYNLVPKPKPYLAPRDAEKCSLYSGRPCAQLKIQSSIQLKGRGNLILEELFFFCLFFAISLGRSRGTWRIPG